MGIIILHAQTLIAQRAGNAELKHTLTNATRVLIKLKLRLGKTDNPYQPRGGKCEFSIVKEFPK